ncbi:MAG: hypothetical protein AAFQ07_00685 [Chloroflexota bacterium]
MTANTNKIPGRVRLVMRAAWAFEHWVLLWLIIFTVFNLLPWLAPVFMELGLTPLADVIYALYGLISHQFAHRSYFLFGEQMMYAPSALPVALTGDFGADGELMRGIIGNEALGYKVAWSDRLVNMFGGGLVTAYLYALLHRFGKAPRLHFILMMLLITPLIIDGTTHVRSEVDGLIGGWRYYNSWLVLPTGGALGGSFYVGDMVGSFNWWVRLITGVLAGMGVMGWLLGIAKPYFEKNAGILQSRLADWRARQETGA